MSEPKIDERERALQRAKQALRLASADMPHLAGLAHLIRLKATHRIGVAAVAPSGLVLVNPKVFASVPLADAAFVLAHELLHLALDTHARGEGEHPLAVNFAHDYVINDMLYAETGRLPPLDGLFLEKAREKSLEELVTEMKKNPNPRRRCWGGMGRPGEHEPESPMTTALREAGLLPPRPPPAARLPPGLIRGDLLPAEHEPDFEPEILPEQRRRLREQIRREALKASSLGAFGDQVKKAGEDKPPQEPERYETLLHAVELGYAPPWQSALQHWLDFVAPGPRTFARPSRRSGDRSDLVLPGRSREGWALHVLLDTSGSMTDILGKALGAIAAFCEASNVAEVHVIQCDIEVTHDDWLDPAELAAYKVAGFGGSDMTPGILHLARDSEVTSVLVLTDGYITMPSDEPPYRILWGLVGDIYENFEPPYGDIVVMDL